MPPASNMDNALRRNADDWTSRASDALRGSVSRPANVRNSLASRWRSDGSGPRLTAQSMPNSSPRRTKTGTPT